MPWRSSTSAAGGTPSVGTGLAGVSRCFCAATVGFDWPTADHVLAKVDEELAEVREAMAAGDPEAVAEEIGDLIFVCTNLGRKMKIDVEAATRGANAKFERRFRHIEDTLSAQGKKLEDTPLDEMEALWNEAKRIEKSTPVTG